MKKPPRDSDFGRMLPHYEKIGAIVAESPWRPISLSFVRERMVPSLQRFGLMVPLLCFYREGRYHLIDGYHRHAAMQEIGYQDYVTICRVLEADAEYWRHAAHFAVKKSRVARVW